MTHVIPHQKEVEFHTKYTKMDSGCWEWQGCRLKKMPYGIFCVLNKGLKAHRVSYVIHKGDIPKGLMVMHTCDNPPCVNPDHLVVGTCRDNVMDMIKKGRGKGLKALHSQATCVHCGFSSIRGLITRLHNQNCKFKKDQS